jgi:hypothetical protein
MSKLYRAVSVDGIELFINPDAIDAIELMENTVMLHLGCAKDVEIPGDYFYAMIQHQDNEVGGEIELINIQVGPTEQDFDVNDTEYTDDTPMENGSEVVELVGYPTLEIVDLADDLEDEEFDDIQRAKEGMH